MDQTVRPEVRVGLAEFNAIPDLTERKVTSSHDFLANIPPYDTSKDYLGPLLHAGHRLSVVGKMGIGKTSLLMEMASAAAHGTEFIGFKGAGVRVLYVNLEMGLGQMRDAMTSARLPHDNFEILNKPDGMAIDAEVDDRNELASIVPDFEVVILDPWYQLLRAELPDSATVGRIVRWLQGLQKHAKNTCFVFGKHLQENLEMSTAAISGFKAFDRNADIILGIEAIGDTRRLHWLKNRSAQLGVRYGEKWETKWERGVGFKRLEDE